VEYLANTSEILYNRYYLVDVDYLLSLCEGEAEYEVGSAGFEEYSSLLKCGVELGTD
jgi:hypothetical protein